MSAPLVHDGRLHSAFFIFIRQPHGYSDHDLLARFGLDSYQPTTDLLPRARHAILCDLGSWFMLADDLYYTLWHMKSTRPVIDALGKEHELFACSHGDCDESFDFVHYRNGNLVRKYIVDSPNFNDQVVTVNFGVPLPGEAALLKVGGVDIGMKLAETLGIRIRYTLDELRCFAPAGPKVIG